MVSEKKKEGLKVDFWRLNGNGKVAVGSQKSYFSVVDFLFQLASLACLRFLSCPHSLSLNFQIPNMYQAESKGSRCFSMFNPADKIPHQHHQSKY